MKISKINTGIYNLLLIEIEYGVLEGDLNKDTKTLTISSSGDKQEIDLLPYIDEKTKEIKVLGLLSLLRERNIRSLLPMDTIRRRDWHTNKFSRLFRELLNEAEWDVDERKTLIVRI